MTHADKQEFWSRHQAGWVRSGLSQTAYCERHGLKLATFGYWRKRLTANNDVPPARKLIPISVPTQGASVRLRLDALLMDVPIKLLAPVLDLLWARLQVRA